MTIIGDASKARILALFIDHVIAFALMMLAVALVPESLPQMKDLFFVFIYLAYFVVLEALWSSTLGKYIQGLVVRKLDGNRCDWTAALIRGFLRIFEVNPLLLGGLPAGLAIIASERKQRIGDMLAGTVVVSNKLSWSSVPLSAVGECFSRNRLTPELTGAGDNAETIQVNDERQANSASGRMSC